MESKSSTGLQYLDTQLIDVLTKKQSDLFSRSSDSLKALPFPLLHQHMSDFLQVQNASYQSYRAGAEPIELGLIRLARHARSRHARLVTKQYGYRFHLLSPSSPRYYAPRMSLSTLGHIFLVTIPCAASRCTVHAIAMRRS